MTRAFVFPGQGSQSIGMLSEYAKQYPIVTETFDEVSDILQYDVWQLTQVGPVEKLNQTEYTQVAMLTADVAVQRILSALEIDAPIAAGHSLGEYAALVFANVLPLADAAKLVQARGRLMQENVPLGEGAMAAIVGLSDEQVQAICLEASSNTHIVTPANYNAIGQVVIAGHAPAVEQAITLAQALEARMATLIQVSVPCHCNLLREASEQFEHALSQAPITTPDKQVISNVDLSIYTSPEQIRQLLAAQLYSPVRWVETIQHMKQMGVSEIIECGPGKVLTGLAKRIDKTIAAKAASQLITI